LGDVSEPIGFRSVKLAIGGICLETVLGTEIYVLSAWMRSSTIVDEAVAYDHPAKN